MRTRSGTTGLWAMMAMLWMAAPAIATAASVPPPDPNSSRTASLVHDFWRFVSDVSTLTHAPAQQPGPAPQAIAPAQDGSPPVDLSDLSKPSEIEARLTTALRPRDGVMHVTVSNGAARLGNFTLGTDQPMNGHLLVVQGDADVYGHLQGNLVTCLEMFSSTTAASWRATYSRWEAKFATETKGRSAVRCVSFTRHPCSRRQGRLRS